MVEGVVCGAVGWVLGVVAGVLGGVVGVLRGWVLGAAEGAVGGVVRGAVGVGAGSRGGGGWWGGVAFRGGGCWGLCWARWRVWCEAPWGWVLGAVAGQIKLVQSPPLLLLYLTDSASLVKPRWSQVRGREHHQWNCDIHLRAISQCR